MDDETQTGAWVSRARWLAEVWPVLARPASHLGWRRRPLHERVRRIGRDGRLLGARLAYEKAVFRLRLKACARRRTARGGAATQVPQPDGAIVTRRLDGVSLMVPQRAQWKANAFDRRLLTDRRYPLNLAHFRRMLACGGTLLDVGAHVGTVSLAHALLGDFRRIHAVEATPQNYGCLTTNIALNGLGAVIVPHHCALGSETGAAVVREGSGSGQHQIEILKGPAPQSGPAPVPLTTLDTLLGRLGRDADDLRFVKSDTEGHDPHVLLGARDFLQARRAVWQMEFCPRLIARRSAVPPGDFFGLIEASFDHVIIDHGTAAQLLPAAALRETLSRPLSRNHIDIFLIP